MSHWNKLAVRPMELAALKYLVRSGVLSERDKLPHIKHTCRLLRRLHPDIPVPHDANTRAGVSHFVRVLNLPVLAIA